jgi:exonuclease III
VRWLEQTQPDVACLQELKKPQEKFQSRLSRMLAMARFGMGRKVGTVLVFSLLA